MPAKITKKILESHLNCRYKSYLQLAGESGCTSDYELMLKESMERVRRAAVTKLVSDKKPDVVRDVVGTSAVLKRGVHLLLDVTLEDSQSKIRFDGLQKTLGSSRLGDFHYIPLLVHESEKPGRVAKGLLDLLAITLTSMQGTAPQWGILIHGRKCEIHRIKIAPTSAQAKRAMQQMKEMQETDTPPQLRLNHHCQICEFGQRCQSEAVAKDDISLLRGVSEKEVSKYNRRGIFTVTQLSCTFRPRKRAYEPKRKGQPHQHPLQALAIRDKKIYVLGSPELPNCAVRIYFDVEGDPDRGFDYLIGMVVVMAGIEQNFSFWADSPADELGIFQQFLDVLSAHKDFRLYSYGGYDTAFLRRMMKLSDKEEIVKDVLDRSINVLSIIYAHVYFPTYSNSLKDIARYLGFDWNDPTASGLQSIVWRRSWEDTGSASLKKKLKTYNNEDCVALRKVTEFMYAACPSQKPTSTAESIVSFGSHLVCPVETIDPQLSRREWCNATFAVPDFEFVNARAYFDYQQDRVFIRTNTARKKIIRSQNRMKGKKHLRVNRHIELTSRACPSCGGSELANRPHRGLVRLAYDLMFTPSGIKRHVTRYTTYKYYCHACDITFIPEDYLRLEEHCHSLKSWAMYMHVAHRMPFNSIAETLNDCYGLPLHTPNVFHWKAALANFYEPTYRRLLEKIVAGSLIHADETDVHLTRTGKGYVWVFTSMEEVVFVYRQSREGGFLSELLKGFRGVLVSDFYTAYDSIDCKQQKCLIHIMRDFNHDIRGNPWDEELKNLGAQFGILLRIIVSTVDRYGLRRYHLQKHQRDVDKFYEFIANQCDGRSDLADGYRARLVKYRSKLFTFLDHDDVPWNNNNAEHAVKRLAKYRALADGKYGEAGINQYLLLLSIYVTCEYKRIGFLEFLRSRQTDIDSYSPSGHKRTPSPMLELYADGIPVGNYSGRRKTWERQHFRNQSKAANKV